MDAMLQHDSATGHDKHLDNAWRGSEAYHFFMLCQRQLYDTNIEATLITAMRCAPGRLGRSAYILPRRPASLKGVCIFGQCMLHPTPQLFHAHPTKAVVPRPSAPSNFPDLPSPPPWGEARIYGSKISLWPTSKVLLPLLPFTL